MAEIICIDENTWRFEDGFVRFFLLAGKNRALMIDSGFNCPDAAKLAGTLTDKPVSLLNTHADGDHTSGTGGFSEIYMHAADYESTDMADRYPNTGHIDIRDGEIIDLGDRPLKLIHIPGHTPGSVAILDINSRSLYSGDSVQKGHIFMFGSKRVPDKYEASLQKLIDASGDYDRIYASHDEYEIPGDYASKVLEAFRRVKEGSVPFEMMDMHGTMVKSYTTEICGFYMD